MKLTPRAKKFLMFGILAAVIVTTTGCSVPRDAEGNIVLITNATTFSDIMANENWFSAIFVWPLSWIINHIAPTVTVGGAIIVVTALVNGVLALLTLKSTMQTQQMQMIQPEIQRIQRKYEGRDDDASKMRMNAEMQKIYSKYNINPVSTLLGSFIQFPIIIAMYMAVQRSEAVQTGSFLGINLQTTPLNGMRTLLSGDTSGLAYLLLFAFMALCQAGSMFLPMYLQKQRAKKEAEKHHRRPEDTSNSQSKMMQIYMMVMILVFGLMWPSAMSLYWAINSLVNMIKTFVIQKIVDKNMEAQKR